jgi:hypothetical protein
MVKKLALVVLVAATLNVSGVAIAEEVVLGHSVALGTAFNDLTVWLLNETTAGQR